MVAPMKNIKCVICGTTIPETHPTCGKGWDICESCRGRICDSLCQDIPLYCMHCKQPVGRADFVGDYTLQGDALHAPGKYWVFRCGKCGGWSRCHESTEKRFDEAIADVEYQRRIESFQEGRVDGNAVSEIVNFKEVRL